jgi:hypothetical protein
MFGGRCAGRKKGLSFRIVAGFCRSGADSAGAPTAGIDLSDCGQKPGARAEAARQSFQGIFQSADRNFIGFPPFPRKTRKGWGTEVCGKCKNAPVFVPD